MCCKTNDTALVLAPVGLIKESADGMANSCEKLSLAEDMWGQGSRLWGEAVGLGPLRFCWVSRECQPPSAFPGRILVSFVEISLRDDVMCCPPWGWRGQACYEREGFPGEGFPGGRKPTV